jgi:hypothetical protein
VDFYSIGFSDFVPFLFTVTVSPKWVFNDGMIAASFIEMVVIFRYAVDCFGRVIRGVTYRSCSKIDTPKKLPLPE